MIRKYEEADKAIVIDIWYQASNLAHPFLDADFVQKVKTDLSDLYLPNSLTWVYEVEDGVIGFISMMDNEIGGLFVLPDRHSKGVGTQLVDFISGFHDELEVEVFEKNTIGRAFYEKYGFKLMKKSVHQETGNEVLRLVFK